MATPVEDVAPYGLVRGVYILCYVFLSGAADIYLESLKSDKDSKFWNHPYVVKAPRFRLVKPYPYLVRSGYRRINGRDLSPYCAIT